MAVSLRKRSCWQDASITRMELRTSQDGTGQLCATLAAGDDDLRWTAEANLLTCSWQLVGSNMAPSSRLEHAAGLHDKVEHEEESASQVQPLPLPDHALRESSSSYAHVPNKRAMPGDATTAPAQEPRPKSQRSSQASSTERQCTEQPERSDGAGGPPAEERTSMAHGAGQLSEVCAVAGMATWAPGTPTPLSANNLGETPASKPNHSSAGQGGLDGASTPRPEVQDQAHSHGQPAPLATKLGQGPGRSGNASVAPVQLAAASRAAHDSPDARRQARASAHGSGQGFASTTDTSGRTGRLRSRKPVASSSQRVQLAAAQAAAQDEVHSAGASDASGALQFLAAPDDAALQAAAAAPKEEASDLRTSEQACFSGQVAHQQAAGAQAEGLQAAPAETKQRTPAKSMRGFDSGTNSVPKRKSAEQLAGAAPHARALVRRSNATAHDTAQLCANSPTHSIAAAACTCQLPGTPGDSAVAGKLGLPAELVHKVEGEWLQGYQRFVATAPVTLQGSALWEHIGARSNELRDQRCAAACSHAHKAVRKLCITDAALSGQGSCQQAAADVLLQHLSSIEADDLHACCCRLAGIAHLYKAFCRVFETLACTDVNLSGDRHRMT